MTVDPFLIKTLEELIAYPTVSEDSNLPIINHIQNFLENYDINSHLIYNDEQTKANIFATVGPLKKGGVVLSGHTDVVPTKQQKWTTDPFTLTKKDNLYFGRGTADMKSFLAVTLSLIPKMVSANLKFPIHLAFSYDEEVGCIGVPSMIEFIKKEIPAPKAVIVGEPTEMKVVSAHKGVTGVTVEIIGKEAHSSQTHLGVSSTMVAGEIINFINNLNTEISLSGKKNSNFQPPNTTLTVNTIQGGSALNILAGRCTLSLDIRSLPEENAQVYLDKIKFFCNSSILPRIKQISSDCKININTIASTPSLKSDEKSEAETLCRNITGDNQIRSVSFAAEAGQFQKAGMETVICGPGSIEQAHKPDEFIQKDQLILCNRFLLKLISKLS